MSQYKKIIAICVAAFAAIILLAVLLAQSLNDSQTSSNVGLRKDESLNEVMENITAEDRQEEYESKEDLPTATQDSLSMVINNKLSSGDFSGLDTYLKDLQENYKEFVDQEEDTMGIIDDYRSDIAYYTIVTNTDSEPAQSWPFNNPDALASAIAYAPISMKYQAFINRSSVLFPPARDNIRLAKASLSNSELQARLDNINLSRTDENVYPLIAVYELTIHGYACEFTAVVDNATMHWHPYSLVAVEDTTGTLPTASIAYEIIASNEYADLDSMFAAPSQHSKYPYDEPNSEPIMNTTLPQEEPVAEP